MDSQGLGVRTLFTSFGVFFFFLYAYGILPTSIITFSPGKASALLEPASTAAAGFRGTIYKRQVFGTAVALNRVLAS